MKHICIAITLLVSTQVFSQVIIGDEIGTATDKTSVLLEFANTNNKGIILPYVKNRPSTPTEGTIILDASNPTTARIKFYNAIGSDEGWTDLSGQDADISTVLASQPTTAENANSKAIIGAESSAADGVLVLESSTKAMVLPMVDDVQNIPSPAPGMMVYVNKTGAKRLAVYNGSKWSFWAP